MKKIFTAIIISTIALFCATSVYAKDMNIYINGHLMVRDIETIGGFDMLPIQDIAAELGFTSWYDGYNLTLYGTDRTYYFHVGDAAVTDNAGGWYGLDVTPREINGKIRVPAKFFCDAFGMPYTWDWVTDTLFLNSDYTYNWLINTWEYSQGRFDKVMANARWYDEHGMLYEARDELERMNTSYFTSSQKYEHDVMLNGINSCIEDLEWGEYIENNKISKNKAAELLLSYVYDPYTKYKASFVSESAEHYYYDLLYKNDATGSYSWCGSYRINKLTGEITEG